MKQTRLSDQIAIQLQEMIADGSLQPAEKLPAERQLAERLGVSRPSLREAIQKLTSKGLLSTRRGGGTYVSESLNEGMVDPLISLLKEQPESRYDVLEVRNALDGLAAYYAALRATDDDRALIKQRFDEMISQHSKGNDPMVEAKADAAFHLSIAEASHNPVLLHIMRGLFVLLQSSIEHNLELLYTIPRIFEPLSKQHENLMKAVVDGSPERARSAAQEHMVFVEESLQHIDQEQARNKRSSRKSTLIKNGT